MKNVCQLTKFMTEAICHMLNQTDGLCLLEMMDLKKWLGRKYYRCLLYRGKVCE